MDFRSAGFVGDYVDDKSHLSLYLPVIESGSDMYVPTRERWGGAEDLKRVGESDRRFINMFDKEFGEFFLKPGDLIFLAGVDFVEECSRLLEFRSIQIDLGGPWRPYGEDYKYKAGDRDEFRALSVKIFEAARHGLLRSLFTSIDSSCGGDPQDYYHVLCGVSDIDFDEWCTIRAIYYRELCCFEDYELIKDAAVARGASLASNEFDSRVEHEIARLKHKYLR